MSQVQETNKEANAVILFENAFTYLQLEQILKKWNENILWNI